MFWCTTTAIVIFPTCRLTFPESNFPKYALPALSHFLASGIESPHTFNCFPLVHKRPAHAKKYKEPSQHTTHNQCQNQIPCDIHSSSRNVLVIILSNTPVLSVVGNVVQVLYGRSLKEWFNYHSYPFNAIFITFHFWIDYHTKEIENNYWKIYLVSDSAKALIIRPKI